MRREKREEKKRKRKKKKPKRKKKKRKERGKSKGREKRARSRCLTRADETLRPSQCFGKRACGARVGVSSTATSEARVGQQQHQGLNPRRTISVPSRLRPVFKAAPREGARQSWVLATDVTRTHTFQDVFASRTTFW